MRWRIAFVVARTRAGTTGKPTHDARRHLRALAGLFLWSSPLMQRGLLVTFAATSRRHSTKLAGRKWTAATRVQKPKPRTAGVSASEHNRARATVEQLQAPTSGTPHRVGVGGRSASIG